MNFPFNSDEKGRVKMQTLIIGIVLVVLIWASAGYLFIYYSIHVDMNKQEHCPYDFVRFSTFIKEFNKYKEDPQLEIWQNRSIFLRKDHQDVVHLHASIVKFNNKCMIFYPISFIKYSIWKKKFIYNKLNENSYRRKGLWN